jgi:hypothetical protein
MKNKIIKVALIVGTGAVENSWKPILKAIDLFYDIKTTVDGANCLFAKDVYLTRYFASVSRKDKEGLGEMLTRLKLLKVLICFELEKAQKTKKLKPRKELQHILEKFILHKNVVAVLISANWDIVVNKEVQRILATPVNKFGMEINSFHIHGSIYDFDEFYLPSEHTKELYRTRTEKRKFDKKNAIFLHNAEIADKIILYGLSLDPLDAELSQVLAACCVEENLKEIIIINPDYRRVAERARILNESNRKIKITCYDPSDLGRPIFCNRQNLNLTE